MENSTTGIYLSIAERDLHDCMQHGDDFFKIELLRQAKKWYTKALEFNMESDTIKQRIAECDKMLAFERKVTGILVVVALVVVGICWIIWK
jgi:hypothetical protein